MADEPTSPRDFSAIAQTLLTTEMPSDGSDPKIAQTTKQPETKVAEVKTDTTKTGIPPELFGRKKEEAKVVEEAPKSDFDQIADPTFQDPKRKADWDGVKSKGREWEKKALENEKKATELQAKIAEFEIKGKDSEGLQTKLAEMEKQHAEWKALVQKVNIELDPEFRSIYVEGRQKIVNNAKAIVEESSLNPKDIEIALNLQGKPRVEALKALADEMDPFQASRLGRLVDQLNELDQAAAEKRSNPEGYFTTVNKQRQEQESKNMQEAVLKANMAYDTALKKTVAELEVLRPVEGYDGWNDTAKQIKEDARQVFLSNDDPQVAATICLQAKAMPVYRSLFQEQLKENDKISKELAEKTEELKKLYSNGSPRLGGGSVDNKGGVRDFAGVYQNLTTTGQA